MLQLSLHTWKIKHFLCVVCACGRKKISHIREQKRKKKASTNAYYYVFVCFYLGELEN